MMMMMMMIGSVVVNTWIFPETSTPRFPSFYRVSKNAKFGLDFRRLSTFGVRYLKSFYSSGVSIWHVLYKCGADRSSPLWEHPCWHLGTLKTTKKNCLIINNSAAHLPIVLKLGRLMCYETPETGEFLKSTSDQIRSDQMSDSGSQCKSDPEWPYASMNLLCHLYILFRSVHPPLS